MTTPLDALLRIKAQVTGAPAVQALGGAIGGVQKQAAGAVGALRRMGAASGGLGGALGALTPLLSAAGLGAMAMNAINAGDAMFDMSQRTGVSVEMLGKFQKAARLSGTSIEAVSTGLIRLSKAMVAAAGSGFGEKTKEEIDQAKAAIERGEKDAVRAVERGADRRLDVLDRETGRRLDKLGKRYRREEQLLNDFYDDQAAAADDAAQDQTDAQIKAIDRRFEAQRRAVQSDKALSEASQSALLQRLEDQRDAELETIRDTATRAQTIRQRASRDARQVVLDELDERRKAEEEKMKSSAESQKNAIKETTRLQVESLKEISDQRQKALTGGGDGMAGQLDELGLSGKGASDAFRELGVAIKNNDGTLRTSDAVLLDISRKFAVMPDGVAKAALAMKLFGRGGAELIPMLNMGGDAIERLKSRMTTEFAAAADQYSDKLVMLGGRIGRVGFEIAEALLPTIEAITDGLMGFFGWLDQQDPLLKSLTGNLLIATIAFAALAQPIQAVVALLGVFGTVALGPLALVAAAVIALGAAFILAWNNFKWFRDGLTAGWAGIVQGWQGAFTLIKGILAGDSVLITKGWNMMIDGIKAATIAGFQFTMKVIGEASKWLLDQILAMPGRLASGVRAIGAAIGNGIFNAVKGIFRGMLQWMADGINGIANQINRLIRTYNKLPGPDIGELGMVSVPKFAQGGYVTGPTVGVLGDNRSGQEYAVPSEKVVGFANNILAGRRGASAIPSGSSSGAGSSGPVNISITTGPIRQDADGQRWMTLEDGERMVRQAVGQMQRTSRTPGGRYAAGVRNG